MLEIIVIVGCLVSVPARADERRTCATTSGDTAIAACGRAIASGRLRGHDLAVAFNYRGNEYHAKGDADRAIADYSDAIRFDPTFANAFYNRGYDYYVKDAYDRAIADYNEAIRLNLNDSDVFNHRGNAYYAKGDHDRAIADYSEAIRLAPNRPVRFRNRGKAYARNGDTERAIIDFAEAIRLDPKDREAFLCRGNAHRARGDEDRAIADYGEAIRLDPGFTAAFTNRGLAHEAKGDREHAAVDFNAALAIPQKYESGKWAHDTARARLAAMARPSIAERRVALVIGNSAYRSVSALPNPAHDASGVAESLRAAGFASVQLVTDATHDGMIQALRAFQDRADSADWAVVYFAGHGIEIGGVNYLVPTDARLAEDRDAQDEAVPLNRVLDAVAGAKKLKLVMLDACRDNPFASQMKRTLAMRAVTRGLARVEPDGATLVVYAAKDGELAADGSGNHSPFSAALINRMREPRVEINRMFRLVTGDVLEATGRRQRPFVYGSIPGDEEFFFRTR